MDKKKVPSINSPEFKRWMKWFIKNEPEAASSFNDEDIYDIYVLNPQ